jgi:hypothetical protein
MTAGRVDGKGGRGSYSGLDGTLQTVLDTFKWGTLPPEYGASALSIDRRKSFLAVCLSVGEQILESSVPSPVLSPDVVEGTEKHSFVTSADLVVCGLWQPIAILLADRFQDMFSTAIPETLSHCYRCLATFLSGLEQVAGPQYGPSLRSRIQMHPLVRSFWSRWRLDLYFQLRCKEVFTRVDRVCSITAAKGGLMLSKQYMLDELYTGKSETKSTQSTAKATVSPRSLSAAECASLFADTEKRLGAPFKVALFNALALELRICLHPSVMLEPLVSIIRDTAFYCFFKSLWLIALL